jgi:hypothetical protein
MTRRPAGTVLPVLAAAVVVLATWLASHAGRRADAGVAPAAERGAPPVVLREPGPRELDRTVAAPLSVAPRGEAPEETVLVRGALTRVDERGAEYARGDGTLEITVWGTAVRGRRRHVTTVCVEDGRWEARLPLHVSRTYTRAVLSGIPLRELHAEEPMDGPAAGEVRVTGRAAYPARVSVIDAATLHDLGEVSIVALEPDDLRAHPGDLPAAIRAAASPLEIPPPAGSRKVYLVGAPGYAWGRVEWDHLVAAPRVVELQRAGAVVVRVEFDGPQADCVVALHAADETLYARAATRTAGPLRIEGVAPGAYRIALEPRSERLRAEVRSLAEVTATVARGAVVEAVLHAEMGERPDRLELAGRIRMSDAWGTGGPHLVLRALGPAAKWHMDTDGLLGGLAVERRGDAWVFRSSTAIADATYLLVESRTRFLREIRPVRGAPELELEIPDPLVVRIEVIDRVTRAPLAASRVAWLPPRDELPASCVPPPAWLAAGEQPGAFCARVPAWDRLDFEARAPGYAEAVATLRPAPGAPESLRIELDRR